ncbi:MAG: ACP S-malonyltransferase [Chloroflexi bacterium]|nr:ACP S-malonyltransferase [Chloroflexota bacterium]
MFWASSNRRDKELVKKTKAAYVFPGQGSQTVGMGLDIYEKYPSAKYVFDEVDRTLGFPLSRLCFEGPEDELIQTINVQPAVLTVSIAYLKAAEEASGNSLPFPDVVAGHSLGEYTALVIAGVLSLSDAVRLVRERGRLMTEAGRVRPGGMAAVLGLDEKTVTDICLSAGTEISNINCPGQIVVSGAEEKLIDFKRLAEAKGARRIIPLKVSGAFHSHLMQPASDGLKNAISEFTFCEPLVPVVANVTAQMLIDAQAIKEELIDQITHCVQWQRSIENMVASGVTTFFEIGHGQVLAGLIKRINPAVQVLNIGDAEVDKQIEKWWVEQRREQLRTLVEKAIQSEKSSQME